MTRENPERVYPTRCLSAYCGKIDCNGCRHAPALQEFKDWVQRTGATRVNEDSLVYVVPGAKIERRCP